FGSESNTGMNSQRANDLTIFNVFKYIEKKHIYTFGADVNYTTVDLKTIPSYFGSYRFASLNSFMSGTAPTRLQRSYYLSEEKENPAKFHTLRSSIFISDETRIRSNFKLNFGLRLDVNSVLSKPI